MSSLSIAKSRNPKSVTPKKGSAKSNATTRRKVPSTVATAKKLTSLVRLSYLGPEIVRALLAGSQSNALTPSRLLRLSLSRP